MDSDRGTHQASKGYPWLPKIMVQEGLDQILTSSGFWVSLEDESSWMCLAMPFSSCQGEMQEETWRLCPLQQPSHAQLHLVSIPGALWASGHIG